MRLQILLENLMICIWILYCCYNEQIYYYGTGLFFIFSLLKNNNPYITLIIIYTYYHLFFVYNRVEELHELVLRITIFNILGKTIYNLLDYILKDEEFSYIFSFFVCHYFLRYSNLNLFFYFIGITFYLRDKIEINFYLLPIFLFIIITQIENLSNGYSYIVDLNKIDLHLKNGDDRY